MLQDEDETVREWAATALAVLRVAEAAEPLVAAYEAVKARGTRLDWTEASGIRWALTELGPRTPVVPSFVAERAQQVDPIGHAWPVGDLVEVIEALASAQQLITFVSAYARNAGSYCWHVDVDVEWPQLDVRVPWTQLVVAARDAALEVATHPGSRAMPTPRSRGLTTATLSDGCCFEAKGAVGGPLASRARGPMQQRGGVRLGAHRCR
jgi:hypothetical protein